MNNGWWLLTVITVVLTTLKITGNISISWLWIFSPIWIPVSIGFVIFICILTYWYLSMEKHKKQKKRDEKEEKDEGSSK